MRGVRIRSVVRPSLEWPSKQSRPTIGILTFDGLDLLEVIAAIEVFARACREPDRIPLYRTLTLGVESRRVISDAGISLPAKYLCHEAPGLETIFVPGGAGLLRPDVLEQVASWLTRTAPNTRRVVALSHGIYALAAAGLLDGRTVTTHWRFAGDFARRFPKVNVTCSASFIQDGPFYTCAGATAAMELSVALVAEDHGRKLAMELARELMTQLRPPGDAAIEFSGRSYQPEPSDRLNELPSWIALNLRANLSVDALADRACLCRRHFTRVFKQRFGKTAADFVEEARVREACRRLRASRTSIDSIADSVGFQSGDAFRRAFRRRLGISPNEFRRHPEYVVSRSR